MSRNSKGLRSVVREITHGANRSSLFWWMVENHDQLASAVEGRRLQWTRLSARFAKLSLTDANGHAPSEQTARKTWQRVRRAGDVFTMTLTQGTPARPNAAGLPETRGDASMEFSTVDAEGNPVEEGKVFYRGRVMTRHAAEQLERLRRGLQEEDRFR